MPPATIDPQGQTMEPDREAPKKFGPIPAASGSQSG